MTTSPTRLRSGLLTLAFCAAMAAPCPTLGQQTTPQTTAPKQTSADSRRVRITGRVVDATGGEGVPYATVSVTDTTGVAITAWLTDGRGAFSHDVKLVGRYMISAAAIDFDRSTREVELAAPATEVGTLELSKGVAIEGVVVTAAPPLVKAEIDKITYNVAADPEAPVNTVLDMLRKVPLLSVDAEDNVLMQGSSNYKVLVNGKSSSMMDRNFKEVVRGMPAGSIKNIEVITSPSSKYEAEGIGGIINIITDRGRVGGYNGSVNAGADSYGSVNVGGFLSAQAGKLSVSGYASGMVSRRPGARTATFQDNLLSDDYRFQNSTSKSNMEAEGVFYNVQASYDIDSLSLVTLSVMGQRYGSDSPTDTHTTITDIDGNVVRSFAGNISGNMGFDYLSGNLDYQRLFRKPDRVFTASYKLSANGQDQRSINRISGLVDYPSYMQKSVNDATFREHTLQFDFVEPITPKHSIETGVKLILRQNDSAPETWSRVNESDEWVFDPARRNALDYDQYILGAYGAWQFKLKKFSVKAGARVENTRNDGMFRSAAADTPFDNRLFNLVPNVTFSFAPKTGKRYTLSYTQRLSRPGIWYLNPYVDDIDPMNVSQGNPKLDSEVGHTFNASYGTFGPKTNFNISAGAAFVNNAIQRVSTSDASGVVTSTYLNVGQSATYNLGGYYSWRPSGKFSISLNPNASYIYLTGEGGMRNSGWSINSSFNTRVAVWKGGTVTANAFLASPRIMLQGTGNGYYYYGFGVSQRAFNQKLTFTLSTNMPFNKDLHYRSITDDTTFYRRSDTWSPSRTVRLNVSWNFGKAQVQVKKARRTINNDDQKAGESSTPSAGQ